MTVPTVPTGDYHGNGVVDKRDYLIWRKNAIEVWLIQSGSIAPLALGLILTFVGIVSVIRPNRTWVIRPNRTWSVTLSFLSLLPAIVGLIVVYSAAADFNEMALSPHAPRPTEFARLTGRAVGSSFCGLLGTILPVFVAVLAFARTAKSVDTRNAETQS